MSIRDHLNIKVEVWDVLAREVFSNGFEQDITNVVSVVEKGMRITKPTNIPDVQGVPMVDCHCNL